MSENKWGQLFSGDTPPKTTTPELVVSHPVKSPYTAFQTADKVLGFTVHCPSVQTGHQFFFHHLHTVTFNEPDYTFLFLTTSTSVIKIHGHNLQPLSLALGMHTCKSMTEFHKELHTAPPPDDGEPFIEKIEVSLIKGAEIQQREKQAAGESDHK